MAETTETVETQQESKTPVQSVEFAQADEAITTGPDSSIDLLLDVEVEITVSLGQTQIPIKQLLQLSPGSVVKLQKNIEEPVDLYLNDSKFATGSIVVVEDSFAIKINDVLNVIGPDAQQAQ